MSLCPSPKDFKAKVKNQPVEAYNTGHLTDSRDQSKRLYVPPSSLDFKSLPILALAAFPGRWKAGRAGGKASAQGLGYLGALPIIPCPFWEATIHAASENR